MEYLEFRGNKTWPEEEYNGTCVCVRSRSFMAAAYSSIFVRYTLRMAPVTSRLARFPMKIEMTLGDGPLVILHRAAGWRRCRSYCCVRFH